MEEVDGNNHQYQHGDAMVTIGRANNYDDYNHKELREIPPYLRKLYHQGVPCEQGLWEIPRYHGYFRNCQHDVPAVQFAPPNPKLVSMYLKPKIENPEIQFEAMPCIPDVNVYEYPPEKLLEKYQQKPAYFFTKRKRYANGNTPNRTVKGHGYWQMTTKTVPVMAGNTEVGEKSGLVFHTGRQGDESITKTNWLMEEYHIPGSDWTLCWIYLFKHTAKK